MAVHFSNFETKKKKKEVKVKLRNQTSLNDCLKIILLKMSRDYYIFHPTLFKASYLL